MPGSEGLVRGFLHSVETKPDRAALELEDQRVTYAMLWQKAGAIARCLNDSLPDDDPLVGLFASRSMAAYSGAVGILASGRGYVPFNLAYPPERTLSMIDAAGCRAIVVGPEATGRLLEILPRASRPLTLIVPDEDTELGRHDLSPHTFISPHESESEPNLASLDVSGRAPAYLLFTSGSTGIPKAVAVSHDNVTAYLDYAQRRYLVGSDDRCSQNFDLTFDLSVHDLFVCWNAGATLCPFSERYLTPASVIEEKALTVWFSVPSVATFASKLGLLTPGAFQSLRLSLFCGEPLTSRLALEWQQAAPHSIVENLYGPTETTIAISHYRWDSLRSRAECTNGIVPLGWIFDGQRCSLVDEVLTPVQVGRAGELCLSGSQVTNGYFHDPARTAQQFITLRGLEEVWYRTGDLARQDEHGCLHYLGRKDHQVKINGYRVELQEIEHVVREATGSDLVVAVPWPITDGSASGVVAVVSGSDASEDDRIVSLCHERLPQYMVPTHVYHVEQLPMTPNGKVDRKEVLALLKSGME